MHKKAIIILISSLSIVVITVIAAFCVKNFILFSSQAEIVRNTDNLTEYYSNYSIEKDGYVLKTKITQENDMSYLSFTVENAKNSKVAFNSVTDNGIWRLIDFKGIKFSDDSLDIIVSSGDVGDTVYYYNENGEWILQ